MASAPVTFKHTGQLDGIRAIAVLIVMVSHAGLGHIVLGGIGVTLFFALSGYLITTLLRAEFATTGRVSLRNFYLRRVLRIFPPMYICIVVFGLLTRWGIVPRPLNPVMVIWDALFLTNYAALFRGGGVPMPLWSLDVEEHFYMVFPLLFVTVLAFQPPRRSALILAALCGLALVFRLIHAATMVDYSSNYVLTHTRFDSILFGALLAVWHNPKMDADAWRPGWLSFGAALGALAVSLAIRDPWFRETLRYTVQGVALFVVFSFVLHDRTWISRVLSSRPLWWVGILSYTLYLCHMPILLALEHHAAALDKVGVGVVGFALSFAFAYAMYRLVEQPMAAIRRRLSATKTEPEAAVAASG